MAKFNEKFVEELKSKVNIVDLVGRYCTLKRQGQNYWACCPLPGHSEKTPSFCVNERGQFYHCFGCHKSGDIIKFVQEEDSLTFIEAINKICDMYKLPPPEIDTQDQAETIRKKQERDRLYEILHTTARFYLDNLRCEQGAKYYNYLINRGFSPSTITSFGMGASLDYDTLPKLLISKGYTESEILSSGVCKKNNKGELYDFEANRVTVPIINNMNKVIAFGGRVLEKKSSIGKYLNTSDTILFNKRNTIYNINKLNKLIKTEKVDYVIMVEGYMDVIALHQAGIKNVVASMGTQLTIGQAKMLKRYTSKVIVSYDGDLAGQDATIRSLDIFANEGFEIKVIMLPDKKDPDEVIRELGVEYYYKLVDDALPLVDYKLHALKNGKNLADISDKRKFVGDSLEIIRTVKDAYLREELLKRLRDLSGISYDSLLKDLENGTVTVESDEEFIPQIPVYTDNSLIAKTERFILSAIINNKPYAKIDADLYFNNEIREQIYEKFLYEDGITAEQLYSLVGENGVEEISAILSAGDDMFGTKIEEKYYLDCIYNLKKYNLESEIDRFTKAHSKEIDLQKRNELAKLIAKAMQKLLNLKGEKQ